MSSMDIEIEERGNFFQQFITNIFVFCGPKFKKEDYTLLTTKFKKKLIFIPKKPNNESADNYIPCLFYRKQNSPNFLIFFMEILNIFSKLRILVLIFVQF